MKKVLFEKFEPNCILLKVLGDIELNTNIYRTYDKILFLSKNILLYKMNVSFDVKPNNKKAYSIPSSRIGIIRCYDKPKNYFSYKFLCVDLKEEIANSEIFISTIFKNDNTFLHFKPIKFINMYEEQIIDFIFTCDDLLKEVLKKIDLLTNVNEDNIKNILKGYSKIYKSYRKNFNTQMIMDEKIRIAKESRLSLSSREQLSHSGM